MILDLENASSMSLEHYDRTSFEIYGSRTFWCAKLTKCLMQNM